MNIFGGPLIYLRIIGLTSNNTDLTYTEYSYSVPDPMLTTSHGSLHLTFKTFLWGKYYSICPILHMGRLGLFFPIYSLISPFSSFQMLSIIWDSSPKPFDPLWSLYHFAFISLITCFPALIHSPPYPLSQENHCYWRNVLYLSVVLGQQKAYEPSRLLTPSQKDTLKRGNITRCVLVIFQFIIYMSDI